MDIETRLTNLENLLNSFIKAQSIADEYKEYDIEGCRNADSRQEESINALSGNVSGSYSPTKDYHQNEYCLFYGNLYRFIRTMGRGISPLEYCVLENASPHGAVLLVIVGTDTDRVRP